LSIHVDTLTNSLFLCDFYNNIQAERDLHPDNVFSDEADFALSSPNARWNAYANLVSCCDENGVKLTNSIILGDPCDMCKTTQNPEQCTHKLGELASWINPRRNKQLRKIYTAIGQEDIFRAK
jgi:uncharacterized short protein YbdD (DUF466 family)